MRNACLCVCVCLSMNIFHPARLSLPASIQRLESLLAVQLWRLNGHLSASLDDLGWFKVFTKLSCNCTGQATKDYLLLKRDSAIHSTAPLCCTHLYTNSEGSGCVKPTTYASKGYFSMTRGAFHGCSGN